MRMMNLDDAVDAVISEYPYVKLLTKPQCEEIETWPGITWKQWTAIAQVDGVLAIVELKITESQPSEPPR